MKNFKTNIYFKIFLFVQQIFSQFLLPTLMILFWGKDNFNLWIYFLSIPLFFSFMQISVAEPARNEMALEYKKKNFIKLNEIYQNVFFLNVINIFIFIILLIFYLIINDQSNILKNNQELIFIIILISALSFLNSPLIMLLNYKGNLKSSLFIEIFFNISISIIIPLSHFFLKNFYYTFYLLCSISILKFLVFFYVIDDDKINKFFNLKLFSFKEIKRIFKYSIGFNTEIISTLFKGPGLIFLIGSTNFITSLALIQTARTLFYYLPIKIFYIFYTPLIFETNKRYKNHQFNKDDLKKFYLLILVASILFILFYLIVSAIGLYIYEFWLRKEIIINKELIKIITVDSLIVIFGLIITIPLKAINKYNIIGSCDLILNVMSVLIIFYLEIYANLILMFKILLFFSILNLLIRLLVAYFFIKNNTKQKIV
jgi:hypothetical protein